MNIPEIITAVGQISGKAYLTEEIQHAVRTALTTAHQLGEFTQDIAEIAVTGFPNDQYRLLIDLPSRFRKFKYIQAYPIEPASTARLIEFVNPPDALSFTKSNYRTDCYYIAGSRVVINLSDLVSSLTFAYWQHPDLTLDDTNTDWIARDCPYLIIYLAVQNLFVQIEKPETANTYNQYVQLYAARLGVEGTYGANIAASVEL